MTGTRTKRAAAPPGPGRFTLVCLGVIAAVVVGTAAWQRQTGPMATPAALPPRDLARLEPAYGTYYGVNLDWEQDSAAAYAQRLGRAAAVYVVFAKFPIPREDDVYLDIVIRQVEQQGGLALLTLEPTINLQAITP